MEKGMKRIVLLLVFSLSLSYLFSQTNNDSVKVIILGFKINMKYQINVDEYTYEFNDCKCDESGCFIAKFPKRFFNTQFYIHIRCKKKFSFQWEYCEVPVVYDSTKKYFLLYRDYSTKNACFRVKFTNDRLSVFFYWVYEEGSEKIYGPNRIFKGSFYCP